MIEEYLLVVNIFAFFLSQITKETIQELPEKLKTGFIGKKHHDNNCDLKSRSRSIVGGGKQGKGIEGRACNLLQFSRVPLREKANTVCTHIHKTTPYQTGT